MDDTVLYAEVKKLEGILDTVVYENSKAKIEI